MSNSPPVTQLLHQWQAGDPAAGNRLFDEASDELRRIAANLFRNERGGHTLQPTAVVNEAFVRLLGLHDMEWQDRAHFFAFAATSMRRVLVDHARSRAAEKRGGEWVRTELPLGSRTWTDPVDVLAMEAALEALHEVDPERSRLAVLRFYAGLTTEELAALFEVSERTIKRRWKTTRGWLHNHLSNTVESNPEDGCGRDLP